MSSRLTLVELAILSSERYDCSGHGPNLVNRMRRHAYTACLRHPAIHPDCWGENLTCQGTRAGGVYNGPYGIYDW